jgi:RNA polymerase subunit RPABC4/transcription elongation factor Spt4
MTALDDGDVAYRVARHYAPVPLWKSAAYAVAVAAGMAASDWLMGHQPRASAIAMWVLGGVGLSLAMSGWRARGGAEATLRRALQQARPCRRCERTVLAWERACPRCGSPELVGDTDRWMPFVMILLGAGIWIGLIALLGNR